MRHGRPRSPGPPARPPRRSKPRATGDSDLSDNDNDSDNGSVADGDERDGAGDRCLEGKSARVKEEEEGEDDEEGWTVVDRCRGRGRARKWEGEGDGEGGNGGAERAREDEGGGRERGSQGWNFLRFFLRISLTGSGHGRTGLQRPI